jgi:hypothetical protein
MGKRLILLVLIIFMWVGQVYAEGQNKIAVLEFYDTSQGSLGKVMTLELEAALRQNGQFLIVPQYQVKAALKELQINSNSLDPEGAKRFGKIVGANFLITGMVETKEVLYRILDTRTYEVIAAGMVSSPDGPQQLALLISKKIHQDKRLVERLERDRLVKEMQAADSYEQKPIPVKETKDSRPPIINITSPEVKRGVKVVTREESITVTGQANDDSGVASVTVNDEKAVLDKDGNFSADILLKVGENRITITAIDTRKNKTTEDFTISREMVNVVKVPKKALLPVTFPLLSTGKYYALVIGNNDYQYLSKLRTAVNDAQEVGKVLKGKFGFDVKVLTNARRKDILSTLNQYRKTLKESDHFLIYYAGHGEFEKAANKAYWLAVDAQRDDPTEWIIADDITSNIKRLSSRHVLIVSDSCYSGTLDRNVETDLKKSGDREEFIKKMMDRPSRTLMASGGNEPVSDSGGKGHSIFADSFIKALQDIESRTFTADELFYQYVRSRVAGRSEQVPEYKEIRNSGHEGGDFIFIKK